MERLLRNKMIYSFHRSLHEKICLIMQPKALEKMNILNNLITLNTVNISGMSIITKIKA